ncbi:MAG: hypothetical protein SNG69_06640 [Rikenellaceae bacterium]
MEYPTITPTALIETAGAKFIVRYKGNEYLLSKLQRAFFITLSNGQRHSSHKLMQQLHTSDPRKEVQYLRRKGINVEDEWIEATRETPRHKRYWINSDDCKKEVGNE